MDLSTWLNEPETARRLGISVRTLLRRVDDGKAPERRMRPRTGGVKPEPVYNPRDVENLEPRPQAQIMRAGDPRLARPGIPEPAAAPMVVDWRPLVGGFLERITTVLEKRLVPPPAPRPWMTPAEGALYLGLSERLIRRLIRTGRLPYVKDGHSWKVGKADLDNIASVSGLAGLHETTAAIRETVAGRKAAGGR